MATSTYALSLTAFGAAHSSLTLASGMQPALQLAMCGVDQIWAKLWGMCASAPRSCGWSSAALAGFMLTPGVSACSTHFVFLLETRCCGLGTNLPSVDTVIIYDSDGDPR